MFVEAATMFNPVVAKVHIPYNSLSFVIRKSYAMTPSESITSYLGEYNIKQCQTHL